MKEMTVYFKLNRFYRKSSECYEMTHKIAFTLQIKIFTLRLGWFGGYGVLQIHSWC